MTRAWSINGRFLAQRTTGVQRYAREIVRALDDELDRGNLDVRDLKVELILPRDARADLDLKAIRTRVTAQKSGHIWEQFVLPRHVEGGLLSFGNVGPLSVARQIVCMHDVTTRAFPQSYSFAYRASYRVLQPLLGRSAAMVATVSSASAEQLVQYGICDSGKIIIIPNGHEHVEDWRPSHSAVTRAAAGPDTIVMIGTPAAHKNLGLILGLAERLEAAGLRLAVAGGMDSRVFQSKTGAASLDAVTWLGRVSDPELAALLQDSLCLAFPSLFEGFGLPPLEAMALGCPTVVSDRSSIPEVCGDAALYCSPERPDAWFDAFMSLRHDASLRCRLIDRGRARVRMFSWKKSAQQYLSAMAVVDDRAPSILRRRQGVPPLPSKSPDRRSTAKEPA